MSRPPALLLWAVATLMVSSCGGGSQESGAEGEGPRTQAVEEVATRSDTVDVILDDYLFGMPATLPAGETTLRISNEGIEEHDLMFMQALGDSAVWRLPARLAPGSVEIHSLVLQPGSYQVVCDFAGHVGRGMIMSLTVEGAPF